MLHPEDVRLVQRALFAEGPARDELVKRLCCVPKFLAVRNRRYGRELSREDLNDCTQDVLSIVWRKLSSFRGEAALETWVYRIAMHEFMNCFRRSTRSRVLDVEDMDSTVDRGASGHSKRTDDQELLEVMLDRLGPPGDDVLRLKHYEGLTFDEVGARLSLSANTVKTHYYRSLKRLRELLELELMGGGDEL
jgi:RNA polymerase sigma-70 factor (ECF subfamily)